MVEKRFVFEGSDYDLKYEFRVADISKVKKTKEDFWNEEEEVYEYRKYIAYLWENDAFLTLEEADELLNALHEENINLKQALWEAEEEYLHEAYNDNPIRLDDKIMDLKEEWDREYWND